MKASKFATFCCFKQTNKPQRWNIFCHGKHGKLCPELPLARQGPAQHSGARGTAVLGVEEKSSKSEQQVPAWPWWQGT